MRGGAGVLAVTYLHIDYYSCLGIGRLFRRLFGLLSQILCLTQDWCLSMGSHALLYPFPRCNQATAAKQQQRRQRQRDVVGDTCNAHHEVHSFKLATQCQSQSSWERARIASSFVFSSSSNPSAPTQHSPAQPSSVQLSPAKQKQSISLTFAMAIITAAMLLIIIMIIISTSKMMQSVFFFQLFLYFFFFFWIFVHRSRRRLLPLSFSLNATRPVRDQQRSPISDRRRLRVLHFHFQLNFQLPSCRVSSFVKPKRKRNEMRRNVTLHFRNSESDHLLISMKMSWPWPLGLITDDDHRTGTQAIWFPLPRTRTPTIAICCYLCRPHLHMPAVAPVCLSIRRSLPTWAKPNRRRNPIRKSLRSQLNSISGHHFKVKPRAVCLWLCLACLCLYI